MPAHPASAVSLYIHLPWCLHKCAYCDFNSHAVAADALPESDYTQALITDLKLASTDISNRPVQSIFIGGGTPSLFSANAIEMILQACRQYTCVTPTCEITLETNPGTFEFQKFSDFHAAGVNRLSIGVQSFNDVNLQSLDRIHAAAEALQAIDTAAAIGFDNINIDIMFGLPKQTLADAMEDVRIAVQQPVQHISYYQLTLEPNTIFHRFPPPLPDTDQQWEIQEHALQLLAEHHFQRYEVSALARQNHSCVHNKHYWRYHDYLGIGAGAHTKLTLDGVILRQQRVRQPDSYRHAVSAHKHVIQTHAVRPADQLFEFMLNNLRLCQGFSEHHFETTTSLDWRTIQPLLAELIEENLLDYDGMYYKASPLGYRFLDQITARFLPE